MYVFLYPIRNVYFEYQGGLKSFVTPPRIFLLRLVTLVPTFLATKVARGVPTRNLGLHFPTL
jgi:hypothetical protein